MSNLHRLMTTQEVRNHSSPYAKIQVLHEQFNIPVVDGCKHLKVQRRTYYRWLQAKKKGRIPHKNGRPLALNEEQEKLLVERIVTESKQQNAMTTIELAREVIFVIALFVCLFAVVSWLPPSKTN